ncbi:DMT family transporter [Undibacterium sp. LX15W]|uniref:DMT family transporter n=1 Tax=Undibacterium flavidum TaxID=2762297 RepID=A0ABR6YGD0_9BURK|nr:DMT family transporter [Undibacterium flavidum]
MSLAITGAILFSAKAIVAKLLYAYHLDAVTVIAFRMLFSLPVFAAIAIWQGWKNEPLSTADRWRLLALGLVGYYLSSFLDFLGLQYISAGLERLILFLTPSFVLLIHVLWFKRPIRPIEYLSLGIAYAGIVLVFMHDLSFNGQQVILGAGLVLGSAIAYATYLIQSGEMVLRIGALRLVSYAMCVSSFACIAQFVVLRPISLLNQSWPVLSLSMVNAMVCTVLPVFLTMFAVQKIGAPKASQAGMIGPVSTLVLGSVFLQEAVTTWQLAGASLVILGMYLLSRK